MKKDPAFLFYTGDFMAGTYLFTDDQVGKYIRLLCLQHLKGELTRKDMLTICKAYDSEIFQKFTRTERGTFVNIRLAEEVTKRRKYTESRSKNGAGRNHMQTICKPYVNHTENENINIQKKEEEGGTGGNKTTTNSDEICTLEQYEVVRQKLTGQAWQEQVCMTQGFVLDDFSKFTVRFLEEKRLTGQIDMPTSELRQWLINSYRREAKNNTKDKPTKIAVAKV